jgi:hypothetical protein
MEPVVQALSRGNSLSGAAEHEGEDTQSSGSNASIQTHLQSNLRSYGFDKRARVLTRLLLLREGQLSSRLFGQVLYLLGSEIRFVQFDC